MPPEHGVVCLHVHDTAVLPGIAEAGYVVEEDVCEGVVDHAVLSFFVDKPQHRVHATPPLLEAYDVILNFALHEEHGFVLVRKPLSVIGDGARRLERFDKLRRHAAPEDAHTQRFAERYQLRERLARRDVQAVQQRAVEYDPMEPLVLWGVVGVHRLDSLREHGRQLLRRRKEDIALQPHLQEPEAANVLEAPLHLRGPPLARAQLAAAHGPPGHDGDVGVAHDEGAPHDQATDDDSIQQGLRKDEDPKDDNDMEPLCEGEVLARAPEVFSHET
mmetsp:Transcript_26561/g.60491  ORF Transcript_26561/g.60491 Transcript_26561/m.60491 type:complete len:274 (-) Transcript_26561:1098-1919(-)